MSTNGTHPTCTNPGCENQALSPDGGECYACLADTHLLGRVAIRDPIGPPFPIDVYPKPMRDLAEAFAADFPCPVEWVAVPMLPVMASGIGNARALRVSSSYFVGPRIWAVVIAAAGSGKSPALECAIAPVKARTKRLMREYLLARGEWEEASAKERGECPRDPEGFTTDITIESLARVLGRHPAGVLCAHDELTGWLAGMNQYKSRGEGSDRQKWLELWAGAAFLVKRVKMDLPVYAPNPIVNLAGCAVTSKIGMFLSGAEDGFSDRFVFSHAEAGAYAERGPGVAESVADAYAACYERLCALSPAFPDDAFPQASLVGLSDSAEKRLRAAESDLMREADPGGQREFQRSAWSKLRAYLQRCALVVALVNEHARVEQDDVDASVALVDYFRGQLIGLSDVVSSTFDIGRRSETLSYDSAVAYLRRKGPKTIRELIGAGVPFCRNVAVTKAILAEAAYAGLVAEEGKLWIAR